MKTIHATEQYVDEALQNARNGMAATQSVADVASRVASLQTSVSTALGLKQDCLCNQNNGDGISITIDATTGRAKVNADYDRLSEHYVMKSGEAGSLPVLNADTSTNGEFRVAVIQIINLLLGSGI